jgi:hypothetical protein
MNNKGVYTMNKSLLISVLMIFALALTACGSNAMSTASPLGLQSDSSKLTVTDTDAVSAEAQLLVGTFKLEGTDNAISAQQVADLLPYWQLLKVLTDSDSAAQEEIDATVDAIPSAMAAKQVDAISAMQITRQDMFSVMREQVSGGTGGQTQNSGSQNNFAGPPAGADFGGGGFPGAASGSQQSTTNQSSSSGQATTTNSSRVLSTLLDALIKLLESKTQS